jgi:hypothetical protein
MTQLFPRQEGQSKTSLCTSSPCTEESYARGGDERPCRNVRTKRTMRTKSAPALILHLSRAGTDLAQGGVALVPEISRLVVAGEAHAARVADPIVRAAQFGGDCG